MRKKKVYIKSKFDTNLNNDTSKWGDLKLT